MATKKERLKHVTADARTLGVSVPHLSMVVRGKRESKSLLSAYKRLKAEQQQTETK